jgi:hypothetical protein
VPRANLRSPAEQKKLAAEEYETALGIAKKIGLYGKKAACDKKWVLTSLGARASSKR